MAKAKKAAASVADAGVTNSEAVDPTPGVMDPDAIEPPDAAVKLLERLGSFGDKAKVLAETVWQKTLADLKAAAKSEAAALSLTDDQLDVLRSCTYLKTLAVLVSLVPSPSDKKAAAMAGADARSIFKDVGACELLDQADVDVPTIIYRNLQNTLQASVSGAIDIVLGVGTKLLIAALVA